MDPLKICFVSSEAVPYAKTGGLADVSGALGKYLSQRGHDVRIFMPFYDTIDVSKYEFYPVDFIQDIPMQFGGFTIHFSLLTSTLPDSSAEVYFVRCDELYSRGKIYTNDGDEYLRFALLSRAAIESCQRMGWGPDIFHCNDWQSALIPLFLRTLYNWDQLFHHSKTLLTIHNIGYQGVFSSEHLAHLKLDDWHHMLPKEDVDAGIINYMKIGLLNSDLISTVSKTYAQEIQTAEYGAGLENILRFRSDRVVGILNGVDYDEWSPETDPHLSHHFSAKDLSGKEKLKQELLQKMGLPYDPAAPVLAIVSRLTGQKGFELLQEILFDLLANYHLQFVVLGSGEPNLADFFRRAQETFPQKMCFYDGYNVALSHLIEAGSDMFVMPSRYEPCGLNQIYSLKYGTVPIVRKTGGLADTVELYDWETQEGTGFVFEYFNSDSLKWAIDYAYQTYQHKDSWQKIMRNGMSLNFSWELQVQQYVDVYRWLIAN